jgi:two-component system chemotaxis response regulator CheB
MPTLLLVDDSAFVRVMFRSHWEQRGWSVVPVPNGNEALSAWRHIRPDLITMDVEMPGLTGVETVTALREAGYGGPIIMVSSVTVQGVRVTLEALAAGADDFVTKPSRPNDLDDTIAAIVEKYAAITESAISPSPVPAAELDHLAKRPIDGLCLVASTGGPQAIAELLAGQPPPPFPVVIVQHMPAGFTAPFAERLAELTRWRIAEAPMDGRKIPWDNFHAVVAAAGRHLLLSRHHVWTIDGPRVHGVIPSADITIAAAADAWGARLAVVVLTGMGDDGARAARDAHANGALVVAESPETATVFGMPRAAIEVGAVDAVWPRTQIRQWLADIVQAPTAGRSVGHAQVGSGAWSVRESNPRK